MAVAGHDLANLARRRQSEPARHVAVTHDVTGRNGVHEVEYLQDAIRPSALGLSAPAPPLERHSAARKSTSSRLTVSGASSGSQWPTPSTRS